MDFSKSRLCPKACGLFGRSSQDHRRAGYYVGRGAQSTGPGGVGDQAQRTSAPAREGWPASLSPALPRRLKATSGPAGLSAGTRHSQVPEVGRHRVGRGDRPPQPQWAPQPRAQGTWDREDVGPPAPAPGDAAEAYHGGAGPGREQVSSACGSGETGDHRCPRCIDVPGTDVGEGVDGCSSVADKCSGFCGTAGDRAQGVWGRTYVLAVTTSTA